MIRPRRLVGILVLAGSACALPAVWERPGTSEDQARRDQTECAALADETRVVPRRRPSDRPGGGDRIEMVTEHRFDIDRFEGCLAARGYRRVPRVAP